MHMKDAIAVPSERSDWKSLKLLDLEFANSIRRAEGTQCKSYFASNARSEGPFVAELMQRVSALAICATFLASCTIIKVAIFRLARLGELGCRELSCG
jgi:hypothetical protein